LQGEVQRLVVASTLSEGLSRLREAAGPTTPTSVQIAADLRAMCRKLGVEDPFKADAS
jgi:hypothetical protein